MKKTEFKDHLEVLIKIISLLTVLSAIFTTGQIKYITIGISIVIISPKFIEYLIKKYKFRKEKSTNKIILESSKHINKIYALAKANEKNLKKNFDLNEAKKVEKRYKKIIKDCKKNQKDYSLEIPKLVGTFEDIRKAVKNIDFAKNMEITNYLIDEIMDLQRILAQLNMYDMRKKFGKYIIKYANTISKKAIGYIDFIGWTEILLGNNNEGKKAIDEAIILIDARLYELKETKNDEYFELIFLKARALRHLGTTFYTYKTFKEKVYTYLEDAKKILNETSPIGVELIKYCNDKPKFESKRQTLLNGIENNIELYKYEQYRRFFKNDPNRLREILNNLNKDIENDKTDENHRKLKLLSLRTQVLIELKRHNCLTESEKETFSYDIDKDLDSMANILNKNIYFDDAMETFVSNRVETIYDDVKNIMNKQN